jgi:phosphoserine phosphatase
MESTVIANEMLEELAEFVGLRERVERITTRAMNGELDFHASLVERVALLRGLPEQVLHDCLERIRFDPGAHILVATLKAHGVPCALVSGGFTFFAEWVAARVGFEFCCANHLLIENGLLAGTVAEPILDKGAKLSKLVELTEGRGLLPADAATVGDGANDLPMLLAAGLGVAYHGKPAVAAAARFRVDHGDLSTLLYFQGYRRSEIRFFTLQTDEAQT